MCLHVQMIQRAVLLVRFFKAETTLMMNPARCLVACANSTGDWPGRENYGLSQFEPGSVLPKSECAKTDWERFMQSSPF